MMSKMEAKKDDLVGKVKEKAGQVTDDPQLEAKGKVGQLKGAAKDKLAVAEQAVADKTKAVKDDLADRFNEAVDQHKQ